MNNIDRLLSLLECYDTLTDMVVNKNPYGDTERLVLSQLRVRKEELIKDIRNNMKTRYTQLKSMSIEELAEWIDVHGQHDNSPWMAWFDKKYCSKCESVSVKREDSMSKCGFELLYKNETECSYCEVYNECRLFPNKKNPVTQEIIEMWLKEEVDE